MLIFWTLMIAISVGLLVVTAAGRAGMGVELAYAHMAISAIMAAAFVLMAVRETGQINRNSPNAAAAVSAKISEYMGLVWAWGALALAITYGTGVVTWKEWPGFFVVFALLSAVSFFMSRRLEAAALQATTDSALLKTSRYLGIALLIGTIIVMVGLVIDGKMTNFLEVQRANWQDWAANNYFFFGAAALAALSAYGLKATPTAASSEAASNETKPRRRGSIK